MYKGKKGNPLSDTFVGFDCLIHLKCLIWLNNTFLNDMLIKKQNNKKHVEIITGSTAIKFVVITQL